MFIEQSEENDEVPKRQYGHYASGATKARYGCNE